jgi:ribosomal protein L15
VKRLYLLGFRGSGASTWGSLGNMEWIGNVVANVAWNLQLWSLVPAEKRDAYLSSSGKKSDTAPVLDLLPLGYSKVLGKGRIPKVPIVVRARHVSQEAERKIKEAGGIVELVA